MTKMAALPIYGKDNFHKTWLVASGTPAHQVCSNDDPRVTLTYFTARSNLVTQAFLWEKVKTVDFFQKLLQPVT